MPVYYIKVFSYYSFEATSDEEALEKFNNDTAFDEMEFDDESPALEMFTYHNHSDHKTLWSE